MTTPESSISQNAPNQECLVLCPIIQEDNIRKSDLLRRADALAANSLPEARQRYIAGEIQRIKDSDEYRLQYGEADMPEHLQALVAHRANQTLDREAELNGLRLADLEGQMKQIDSRINAFINNCKGRLVLQGVSQETNQAVAVTVCDSPQAAQISEGEPIYWHQSVASVRRELSD